MNTTRATTRTCQACSHWNALEDGEGECRRHAPQNIVFEVDDEICVESRFPHTAAQDWCGDFSAED